MLLTVDIGNTNITFGVFRKDVCMACFRMTTNLPRTSDEYGSLLCDLLKLKDISQDMIKDVIISSVVPNVMYSFRSAILKYLNRVPIFVDSKMDLGISILANNPKEVGADRIVNAVAALQQFGGPVLVIDFGTATTYDLILADGSFVARVTAPGIRISANALWRETAKLPEIEIKKPPSILAKDTVSSMQAGLVYGYIGQTKYMIERMKQEAGISDWNVIATGGLGKLIAEEVEEITQYEPDLTLQGLRLIYEKVKGKEFEACNGK